MINTKHYEEIVSHPGKFEGEAPITAYLYDQLGDGDYLGDCEEGSIWYELFALDVEECEAFGIEIGAHYLVWEDSQGFVYARPVTGYSDAQAFIRQYEGKA